MNGTPQYTAKIARKISEFSAAEWESVYPPVLENYNFFKTLDESHFLQFSFFYLMVYDGKRPVGSAPCFTMEFALDMTVTGTFRTLLAPLKRIAPAFFCPKVLMCGLPMGQGRIGIAGDPEGVLDAVCAALEEISRQEKAAMIVFKDFDSSYDAALAPLARKGFFRIESLPSTDMEICFTSLEQYTKSLSPASREGLRRKLKKTDGKIVVEMTILGALDEKALAEVYPLYLQTYRKRDMGLELVPPEFFANVSRTMPQETKFFLWRVDGKLMAFAFCLAGNGDFIDYYLGFDYAVEDRYHPYFIRFRDLMKWCIGNGIRRYEMGVTGYEAKRRLGFRFIRLFFYMRYRNPLMNACAKILAPLFSPERFDPVFKAMKKQRCP